MNFNAVSGGLNMLPMLPWIWVCKQIAVGMLRWLEAKSLLNKICPENLTTIVDQLASIKLVKAEELEWVIRIIFKKAWTKVRAQQSKALNWVIIQFFNTNVGNRSVWQALADDHYCNLTETSPVSNRFWGQVWGALRQLEAKPMRTWSLHWKLLVLQRLFSQIFWNVISNI